MHSDYDRVKVAIEYVRNCAGQQPSLQQIADKVDLSPAWFQRVFRRWAGVSPKRWLQYLSASEAKRLLRDSMPVLDTAFAVGLSGPGRLHDLLVATEGVTPGEYAARGRGLRIRFGWQDSPFGKCLIGLTGRGVCALRFADESQEEKEMEGLRSEWPEARLSNDQQGTAEIADRIFASGRRQQLLLDVKGTNFQLRVWEALLKIPEGCAISYSDLADRLGAPKASRAVARAVGANPVGYLIPCHRVLRASGEPGGYRWGIERKELMLSRELARSGRS